MFIFIKIDPKITKLWPLWSKYPRSGSQGVVFFTLGSRCSSSQIYRMVPSTMAHSTFILHSTKLWEMGHTIATSEAGSDGLPSVEIQEIERHMLHWQQRRNIAPRMLTSSGEDTLNPSQAFHRPSLSMSKTTRRSHTAQRLTNSAKKAASTSFTLLEQWAGGKVDTAPPSILKSVSCQTESYALLITKGDERREAVLQSPGAISCRTTRGSRHGATERELKIFLHWKTDKKDNRKDKPKVLTPPMNDAISCSEAMPEDKIWPRNPRNFLHNSSGRKTPPLLSNPYPRWMRILTGLSMLLTGEI